MYLTNLNWLVISNETCSHHKSSNFLQCSVSLLVSNNAHSHTNQSKISRTTKSYSGFRKQHLQKQEKDNTRSCKQGGNEKIRFHQCKKKNLFRNQNALFAKRFMKRLNAQSRCKTNENTRKPKQQDVEWSWKHQTPHLKGSKFTESRGKRQPDECKSCWKTWRRMSKASWFFRYIYITSVLSCI